MLMSIAQCISGPKCGADGEIGIGEVMVAAGAAYGRDVAVGGCDGPDVDVNGAGQRCEVGAWN